MKIMQYHDIYSYITIVTETNIDKIKKLWKEIFIIGDHIIE